jgi:hypothetical protein
MRRYCLVLLLMLLGPAPALADLAAGLAAYDAGDYVQARTEWQPLARAGDPEAQIALAELYIHGLGVVRDAARGVYWYRQAACRGAVVARLNLGDLYDRGLGVTRDRIKAYAWLELAARSRRPWAIQRRDGIGRQIGEGRIAEAKTLAAHILESC